ncbi:hypothetical protein MED121_16589 [Marinomonas sp. MED121]|uniref:hypothetical protein n=1 Tax=Marinomonas sp. MED121 TaxID=314277 RepID=UPI0000690F6F|nr:hypothetical protein [Marinomonas sp. MED121]EAQ67563.1 hypothetical protein MED121_16589 [Marinomonas sp. MED121]
MKNIMLIAATVLFSTSINAGSCKNCKVTSIGSGPYYGGKCVGTSDCVVFNVVGGNKASEVCNGYKAWSYVFDVSTDTGKSVLTQLTVAYSSGALVTIHGTGSCDMFTSNGGIEELSYMYFPQ